MNPIAILDGILMDYATPRVRRLIHSLLLLAAAAVSVWLAAEGDWREFVIALVATLYTAANKANTPATDLDSADQAFAAYEAGIAEAEAEQADDEVSGN